MLYATVGCGASLVETALLHVMVYRSYLLLLAEIVMHHVLVDCGALPPLEETALLQVMVNCTCPLLLVMFSCGCPLLLDDDVLLCAMVG